MTTQKRQYRYYEFVMAAFVTVLLCSNFIGAAKQTTVNLPLLGDIPLLGELFTSTNSSKKKRNLMVFIRPYVLRTAADGYGLTQDRYDYLRGEQNNNQLPSRALFPDMPAPKLPETALKEELPPPSESALPFIKGSTRKSAVPPRLPQGDTSSPQETGNP